MNNEELTDGPESSIDGTHTSNTPLELDSGVFPDSEFGIALRFYTLLILKIIPCANQLNTEYFRIRYKTLEVAKVYRKHSATLRKIFGHYSTIHTVKQNKDANGQTQQAAR